VNVRTTGRLVAGEKPPYTTWTFLEVPARTVAEWGGGARFAVRAAIAGQEFHGTLMRTAAGPYRVPVARAVLETIGAARGDVVKVELRQESRPEPAMPVELRSALVADPGARERFSSLAPSMRRAWIEYVGEAKKPETRRERAARSAAGIRAKAWPR
jgi:hypothetical protein